MATSTYYEPLHAVPPLTDPQPRFGALLDLRARAQNAYNAMAAAPKKAAAFAARLADRVHLTGAVSWLHQQAARIAKPVAGLANRLGSRGLLAAVTAAVADPRGQAVLRRGARITARVGGWSGRTAYSLIDRGLRLFGRLGNRAADALFDAAVAFGGKLANAAAPVVHRVARFADPTTPPMRVIAGVARSYLLHRLLKGFIRSAYARLLIEGLASTVTVDSGVARWMRSLFGQLRLRLTSLRAQRQTLQKTPPITPKNPDVKEGSAAASADRSAVSRPMPMPPWVIAAAESDEVAAPPQPSNRAERRLQQREQNRRRSHPANR